MAGKSYLAVVARCDALQPKRAMGHLTQGYANVDEAREWAIRGYESMTGLRVWALFEVTVEYAALVEWGSVKADEKWTEEAKRGVEERVRPLLEQLRLAFGQGGAAAVSDDTDQEGEALFAVQFGAAKKVIEEDAAKRIEGRMSAEFPDDPQPGEVIGWPCLTAKTTGVNAHDAGEHARRDQHQMGFGRVSELNQGQGVIVAVLATGCRRSHPMCEGNVTEVIDATGIGGGSADVNGYGTAICSMLVSQHPSGAASGTARRVKVVPIQVMHSKQGYCTDEWVELGVDAAKQLGAHVVLMPFGATEPMPRTHAAIKTAIQSGITFVAASGDVREGPQGAFYPGAYPEVIAVGAVDGVGQVPAWCAVGPHVDLLACGDDQVAAGAGESIDLLTGSGPAAAHVAAAAALFITRWREVHRSLPYPNHILTALEVTKRMREGADEIPFAGPGVIDVGAALAQVIPARPIPDRVADQLIDRRDWFKGATVYRLSTTEHINPAMFEEVLRWMRDDESDRLVLVKPTARE